MGVNKATIQCSKDAHGSIVSSVHGLETGNGPRCLAELQSFNHVDKRVQ